MTREELNARLYEKYIAPTERKRTSYVGIEVEMPVVDLSGEATDFQAAQDAAAAFINYFGFKAQSTGI